MPENSISRRSLTKSAAWSVPVVAVAVAAPMAAASTTVDIVVSGSCATLSVVGTAGTAPRFTASAVGGGVIPAQTQFTLSSTSLASVNVQAAGASVEVLPNGDRVLTVLADTTSLTVSLTPGSGIDVVLLASFTLSVRSIPTGYVDSNAANNSASRNFSGTSLFGTFTGLCV
ncbi:hypothetical protein [Rathayibacter sp. SD072]|uniref:hypothetical protein n=1 Tax=Rathayibacter sp. SD072 TaxID=2781731 RepID=UPI001A958689|nr:hypothetical protein [Rathayibacter sp. SD072]MBO0984666.1 hypothetical protein [Rathayibacter sp. SD072]